MGPHQVGEVGADDGVTLAKRQAAPCCGGSWLSRLPVVRHAPHAILRPPVAGGSPAASGSPMLVATLPVAPDPC